MSIQSMEFSNPYPFYLQKREHSPIYQDEQGTWHLTRYRDVALLLSDHRFCRKSPVSLGYVHQNNAATMVDALIGKWSLFNDPPSHTRLREMLSVIITPRFIKDTKAMIESVVDALVSSLLKGGDVNFMEAFAYPLPISVINQLLGSTLDVATVRKWSFAVSTAMDHGTQEELEAIAPTIVTMQEYFRDLTLKRTSHPCDDWISGLVKLKAQYQLSIDDIVSNCIFLLLAAHETLQLSLGLGLLAILNHPEQQLLLQNNLDLVPSAVEEMLRYDAPWNKLSRWTSEEVIIGDVVIPKNQLVVGLVNAANRDPIRFPHPDKFDITRINNRHLTFGGGIHLCHGALLARLELQAAFAKLTPFLHRFTIIQNQLEWLPNTSLRYISKLMVRISHDE